MKKQIIKELFRAVKETRTTVQKKQHYLEIPQIVNHLAEQISTQTYHPSPYTCFAISDPTPREILAPSYPDRIVHRWLVNKMEPYLDKRFLSCSYANRTGKGHHRAVTQLRHYLHNPNNKWYLKMDIESFFNSIDHAVLLQLVKRWIEKMPSPSDLTGFTNPAIQVGETIPTNPAIHGGVQKRPTSKGALAPISAAEKEILFSVCQTIITHNPTHDVVFTGNKEKLKVIPRSKSYFNNPPGRGLPLGNLSSQFFGNIYLHELDWFVKHKLPSPNGEGPGVRYIRYVDDVVLLAETSEQLKEWRNALKDFLKKDLKLNIHPKKTMLQPIRYGIDFLGYIVKPDYILVRRRVVKNFKRKLYFYNNLLAPEKYPFKPISGNESIEKMYRKGNLKAPIIPNPVFSKNIMSSINSYLGIFASADSYRLRKNLYFNRFGNLQKMFYATNHFQKTGLMKKYRQVG